MTSIQLEHKFDFSLAEVVAGREARYTNREWWPEIVEVEIENEEMIDGVLHRRRRLLLENKIAKNQIIKEKYYTITELSKQNLADNLYEIEAILETHKKLVDFRESSRYLQYDDNGISKSKREIELKVNIKVPILGKVVEMVIAKEFEKLSNKDKDIISKYLGSQQTVQ